MPRPHLAFPVAALAALLTLGACEGGEDRSPISSALDGTAGDPAVDGDTRNDGMSAGELGLAVSLANAINSERFAAGLRGLDFHDAGSWAAYWHSVDMQELGFFGDVNPAGQDPFDRLQAVGVTGLRGVDEIVARAPDSTNTGMLTYAFMSSWEHREKVLHPNWTHVAVGVHTFKSGNVTTNYWTVMFLALGGLARAPEKAEVAAFRPAAGVDLGG